MGSYSDSSGNKGGKKMNRYEKMGIDPTTKEGLTKLLENGEKCMLGYTTLCIDSFCPSCWAKYLTEEVPTKKVKRWELYDGNVEKVMKDHANVCRFSTSCNGRCTSCLLEWMMEEVEVEE